MMRREKRKKQIVRLRYLVYLVLVTTVISSTTLARFATRESVSSGATIAAFVFGSNLDLDLGAQGALAPGETKTIYFSVTNSENGTICEVPVDYEMQIETTGNLPLKFSLTGQKVGSETDDSLSTLAGPLDEKLCAKGGKLPSARTGGETIHRYTLNMSWPQDKKAQEYSREIDHLSVKIKTTQAAKDK